MVAPILVLASWVTMTAIVIGTGLLVARFIGGTHCVRLWLASAIWWGVGLLATITLAASLILPLRSAGAGFVVLGSSAVLALPGWWLLFARARRSSKQLRLSDWRLLLPVALGAATIYLAFKATGPATNYDTGLYHYGMIRYAGDFGTVPGLANLFVPFGYANAQFPMAALLMNGPWGIEGWRLFNGLVFLLAAADLLLRISARRWSWGTFVLLIGMGAVSLPLIGMADGLVTSPTSDTSVLLLSLVGAAYFCDVLEDPRRPAARVSVIVVATALSVALRPTMLVFAAGMAVALVLMLVVQRRFGDLPPRFWVTSGAWLAVLGGVQTARDYYLSGWFIYPLSLFQWNVPWLSRDPVYLREATLAAARNPFDPDGYQVANSWNWLVPWFQRLPSQWETWFLLVGLIISGISVIWVRRLLPHSLSGRLLLVALAPCLVAITAWFLVSPPSFRFAWGPIFLVPIIVIAWSGVNSPERLPMQKITVIAVSFAILSVTAYSSAFRNQAAERTESGNFTIGSVSIRYSLAPLPDVPTADKEMRSGLVVQEPITGDQCWANYPLCTYSMGDKVAYLGSTIAGGFALDE